MTHTFAFNQGEAESDRRIRNEYDSNSHEKAIANQVDVANAERPSRRMEAPPLIKVMTPEGRLHAEARLVKKIDFRLLPAVIIM